MGDDLNRAAQIVTAPFLGDDIGIDSTRGHIVRLARRDTREALVMAQIQVRLCPIIGDIAFAMLIGAHRARIDIQIGIQFAQPDLIAPRLQQRAKRG